jgi:hypothetical protein
VPRKDTEALVAQFSSAAVRLDFELGGPGGGSATHQQQLGICHATERGLAALRRVSPVGLGPTFDDAENALRTIRAALETSGPAPDG